MSDWPNTIPEDLREPLANALSYKYHGPPELWSAFREWLIKHGVEAPEMLPEYKVPDPGNLGH